MQNVTDAFVKFAQETTYDSIPPEVIRESKRILLDGLGNALGGIASDKGKIGIMQAKLMGGVPEATVIGVGGKYSAAVSAFANAELWNGLDMYPVPQIPVSLTTVR
ncbi:MAG: MmgE/PrpD family protein, partial [Oscillospiraceae bacterium]